ncbi:hypothetical protein [Zhihengliuella salsuginis]|uniref:Uncharacterized protein n=1 Tax=Zhihengliuella salsuginis TaxID=578222 RepID=A0ABQ3GIE2_9MICC|nr:hypothetical protein [Zhihengliuella salsuginis]GHD07514.1 hypothetical protein GCM10008096_18340 [Zhihengliuella salsuginis]
MSSQTHPPIRRDTPEEPTEPAHDTLKPSAGFVIWGVVLLVLSPMLTFPLAALANYGALSAVNTATFGWVWFPTTAGTVLGLVLLLIGIRRALTALHVGAREAARASGQLAATENEDSSVTVLR